MSLKKIENDTWEKIKFYCENCDFPLCKFICDGIDIEIKKLFDKVTLFIDFSNQNINFMDNLPINVNELIINISEITDVTRLENIFKNLPYCLNKIKFIYKKTRLSKIKETESLGKFNFLFDVKLPFNCDFEINYGNIDFKVIHEDLETIQLEMKFNIKKIYNIKKIIYQAYDPLGFWFNQSPSSALPLVSLNYNKTNINLEVNFD